MIALELVTDAVVAAEIDRLVLDEVEAHFLSVPEPTRGDIVGMQVLAQRAGWAADHARVDTYAILRDETLVGRLLLAPSAAVTVIVDLLVAEPYRRRGVAAATMARVVEQVPGPLALTVRHGNPARSLYEKLGFVETAADDVLATMRLDRE